MLHPISPRFAAAVVLALATLGLVGFGARPAVAADWTLKPADNAFGAGRHDYRYTINPGGEVADGIVVANGGMTPLHLGLRAADGDTGAWVRLDRGDVTVRPGESVEVPFAISLPDDAAAGDHVGGIVASQAEQRAVIPIRLRVGGALKPSLAVEDVRVDHSDDATVTYTIRNTGNAILTARQAVEVTGPFGRWAARAGRIPDSPPLLPGETWKGSARVHGVTPALRLTATVTLVPLLTDAAGSTAPLAAIETAGRAWTVPWASLLAILLLCALVVAGLALRPRRRGDVVRR